MGLRAIIATGSVTPRIAIAPEIQPIAEAVRGLHRSPKERAGEGGRASETETSSAGAGAAGRASVSADGGFSSLSDTFCLARLARFRYI